MPFAVLQVGVTTQVQVGWNPQSRSSGITTRNPYPLTLTEARTHFAAWAIVSSPLILGLDMTNKTAMDEVWPIISNRESIVRHIYCAFLFSPSCAPNANLSTELRYEIIP